MKDQIQRSGRTRPPRARAQNLEMQCENNTKKRLSSVVIRNRTARHRKGREALASTHQIHTESDSIAEKKLGGITGKGFMPGQSGNPGGRPKGSVKISSCYELSLARPFPEDPQGRTYAQVIADRAVGLAAEGRIDAIREVTDRTEGRSKQTIDFNRADLRRELLRRTVDDLSTKYGKPREEVMSDFTDLDPTASEFLMGQ